MLLARGRNQQRAGFTIVELLIVIVVIAILAAIVIVAYNGVQRNARISMVKNDLAQAKRVIENYKTTSTSSQYPADLAAANLQASNGVTFTYELQSGSPSQYCIVATYGELTYYASSTTGDFQAGTCILPIAAATIPEVVPGYFETATSTTGTFNVTTSVLPTDLIVVVILKGYAGVHSISGWGGTATWTNIIDRQSLGYPDFFVYTTTGMSGPGSVTLTGTVSTASVDSMIYVIRGLDTPSATATIANAPADWTTTSSPGTNRISGPVSVSSGQAAIMVGWASNAANANGSVPAQPTPASGWVADRTFSAYGTGLHYYAHYLPSVNESIAAGVYLSTTEQGGSTIVVFGV